MIADVSLYDVVITDWGVGLVVDRTERGAVLFLNDFTVKYLSLAVAAKRIDNICDKIDRAYSNG